MKIEINHAHNLNNRCLGISDLKIAKMEGLINDFFDEDGDLMRVMEAIAEKCNTLNELAYFMFYAGRVYESQCSPDE